MSLALIFSWLGFRLEDADELSATALECLYVRVRVVGLF